MNGKGKVVAIKNILVAYNGFPGSEAALSGAVQMQAHYDAHLTGLFAHGGSKLSQQIQPWMPQKVKDAIMEVEEQSNQNIKEKFDEASAPVPADKRHWIESEGPVQRTIAAYARLYDIIALGIHETTPEYRQSHIEIYPDRIALDSGRPVIIFPSGNDSKVSGRRVVVAWDGGRAAARALADAMGILGKDDRIEIVSVGRAPLARSLPGFDVCKVLERHGFSVTLTELPRGRDSVAETLIKHCEAVAANLLVMGAYDHSPLREGLIGGVTQDIAIKTRIPVLMSH